MDEVTSLPEWRQGPSRLVPVTVRDTPDVSSEMGQTAPSGKTTLSANVATQGADHCGDIRGGSRAKWRKPRCRIGNPPPVSAAAKAAPDRSLVEGHLTLVEQIVVQVAVNFPRHVDRGELVRSGVLGLVEAANRFDQAKGVPFDKFASRRIRGAILDAVRSADWAPRSVRALARKADSAEQRLASKLGRMPSMDELATEVGATPPTSRRSIGSSAPSCSPSTTASVRRKRI